MLNSKVHNIKDIRVLSVVSKFFSLLNNLVGSHQ